MRAPRIPGRPDSCQKKKSHQFELWYDHKKKKKRVRRVESIKKKREVEREEAYDVILLCLVNGQRDDALVERFGQLDTTLQLNEDRVPPRVGAGRYTPRARRDRRLRPDVGRPRQGTADRLG